jgi:hypothetical protein
MFKYILCILVIVIVFLAVHMLIEKKSNNMELFQDMRTNVDFVLRNQAQIVGEDAAGQAPGIDIPSGNVSSESSRQPSTRHPQEMNSRDYVLKSDIERAARESARTYCPVAPDYNPANWIKKTELDLETACPKLPDMKDYILKSTIPPVQKCPSCICPKVKVSAGMCKECPEPKNNCPKCEPCGFEQCADVIQCAPGDQQVSCPKCPSPEACPEPPEKVCPAFELPESDIQCPPPQPCSAPGPCPNNDGRCPEQPESECEYYGIKEVAHKRSVNDIVNELLLSDDPKLKDLLENLKSKLDLNLTPPPPTISSINQTITEPTITSMPSPTTSGSNTIMTSSNGYPLAAPTTSSLESRAAPNARNNANHQYELDSYRYSSLNRLDYMGDPSPTFESSLANNVLDNSTGNMGCDINGGNCSYNTNLNI